MDASRWRQARRVLCARLDQIGDVLMTTPALRAVRETPPGRHVTLLTSRVSTEAAALVPEVDETIAYDAPWMKATAPRADPGPDLRLIEQLREGRYDAAIIFTVYSQSPLPTAMACALAGVPLRLAHCRENPYQLLTDWLLETEPERGVRHEVRRQLDLVAAVGFQTGNERLSLAVARRSRLGVFRRLLAERLDPEQPWVAAHPGSSAPSRRYPSALFAEALRQLRTQGVQVVLTGSASETPLCEEIRLLAGMDAISLAGKLRFAELAAVIEAAPVLVSNNTAPAHIAAAVGTPVVDLYALTNPQHTPWQVESRVLSNDVPCRNCYRSVCPLGHHACLAGVAPERVVAAVLELLGAK